MSESGSSGGGQGGGGQACEVVLNDAVMREIGAISQNDGFWERGREGGREGEAEGEVMMTREGLERQR